jgi:tetratricopeptide (TPR) repeat protein
MTDYQRDLARIEDDITSILAAQSTAPAGLTPEAGNSSRLYYRRFQHLSLIGDLPPLAAFDAELTIAIAASPQPADLWLLKAHIALRRHRFNEAEAALNADTSFATSPHARLLRSDIKFQRGHYATARTLIESVIAEDPTWDALARLAYLTGVMGDICKANALYAQAEDEVTAKQMQTYAWLELQRGTLHFQRGDHTTARRHYNRAEAAYTGYWLTTERIAELDGAQGHFPEAIAAYTRLHNQSPRPEYKHALADLHALSGDMHSANHWQHLAYAQYLESITSGEVYHLHYLVDLCCELAGHAEEAIAFGRQDLALRNSYMTQGDLAWALYRNNNLAEATTLIETALASEAVSSRLYFQAACIFSAIGNATRSAHFTHLLKQANPLPARARIAAPSLRIQPWSQAQLA